MTLLWKFVIFIALCKAVCMVPDTVADSVNSSPCEDGWEPYGDEYCSKLFRDAKNWSDASNSCIDNGGYLASIHSKEQNDIIQYSVKDHRRQPLWIGLYADLNDKYVWVDGTQVDYTKWAPGEPDGGFIPGDCVRVFDIVIGMWSVHPCNRKFFYICQKKVAATISRSTGIDNRQVTTTEIMRTEVNNIPVHVASDTIVDNVHVDEASLCDDGWKRFDKYCFKVHPVLVDWRSASADCKRMGGLLASIHSKEQNDFLKGLSSIRPAPPDWYIGLHDHGLDGIFEWDDGTDVDYTNWATGEPEGDYDTGVCVAMNGLGTWSVQSCDFKEFYLCQKKVATEDTNTEVDHTTYPTTGLVAVSSGVSHDSVSAATFIICLFTAILFYDLEVGNFVF